MDVAVRSGFVCEHTLHGFERIHTGFLLKGEIALAVTDASLTASLGEVL
jgi:hypothetical protein